MTCVGQNHRPIYTYKEIIDVKVTKYTNVKPPCGLSGT